MIITEELITETLIRKRAKTEERLIMDAFKEHFGYSILDIAPEDRKDLVREIDVEAPDGKTIYKYKGEAFLATYRSNIGEDPYGFGFGRVMYVQTTYEKL